MKVKFTNKITTAQVFDRTMCVVCEEIYKKIIANLMKLVVIYISWIQYLNSTYRNVTNRELTNYMSNK